MAIVNGTAGNDTLNGTAGADSINGLAGNDRITGAEGNDLARMGAGNDTFFWQVGDGDDTLRGQDGFDTLVFEGSPGADFITVARNVTRVRVSETFGNALDLDDVERIIVRTLAGADGVFINNLAGTDVKQVVVDLAGVPGGIGGDGEVDGVVRNGGAGNDTINVALVSGAVSITGPSAEVTIRNADATDILEINGLGGNDTINASKLTANVMQLTVDGGAGNDRITGSRGNDELDGGDGNDVVAGGRGNDLVDLGAGNDQFAWSLGDGKDSVNGGAGFDTLLITGSGGNQSIGIQANGGLSSVTISNGLATTEISADDLERIKVHALAGIDTIEVNHTAGSVPAVDIDLAATVSGTLPDAAPDTVRVFGTLGDDVIEVTWSGTKVVVAGLATDVSIAHAGVNDQLSILGSIGNDILDASNLPAGKISLHFDVIGIDTIYGSAGKDVVTGAIGTEALVDLGAGNDLFLGTSGDDVAHMGAGNDTMIGGAGNDFAYLGAGNDRYSWSTGDGTDTVNGGAGIDTFNYFDPTADPYTSYTINTVAGRVNLSRTAGEVIRLNAVERLQVMVSGGEDTIAVDDLSGTGVKLVAIDLAPSAGSVVGDRAADYVDLEATAGNDLVTIGKFAGGVSITGLPAQVTITHADNRSTYDLLLLSGGEGNDTINASAMPDLLNTSFSGGDGNDRIIGGACHDVMLGDSGSDTLSGGSNQDVLSGDAGNDRLFGGDAGDQLSGGSGNDQLYGGRGGDGLDGGSGNDLLIGGRGNDGIRCGDGADRVKYTSVLDGHDNIRDFDGDPAGGQDVLDLDALFDSLGIAASDRAARVNITEHSISGEFFWTNVSVNADGKAGFELLAVTFETDGAVAITIGQDVILGTL